MTTHFDVSSSSLLVSHTCYHRLPTWSNISAMSLQCRDAMTCIAPQGACRATTVLDALTYMLGSMPLELSCVSQLNSIYRGLRCAISSVGVRALKKCIQWNPWIYLKQKNLCAATQNISSKMIYHILLLRTSSSRYGPIKSPLSFLRYSREDEQVGSPHEVGQGECMPTQRVNHDRSRHP